MAKIPLPERGQPLDLSYIYQIASAINDISTQIAPSTYKYVTIDTKDAGKQNIRTSDAKIIGGYIEVANNATVDSKNQKTVTYSFPDFKFPPIVTATPVNISRTEAGRNVSVIIENVTASSVTITVTFNTSGEVSLGVNLLIIGIPYQLT